MTRSLKKLAARVASAMGKKPADEADIETERVPRLSAAVPDSQEVTQPFVRRPRAEGERRVSTPSWELPTAPAQGPATRTAHDHRLPAYLAPIPGSLAMPAADTPPHSGRSSRNALPGSSPLAGMPMDAVGPPSMREPASPRREQVHTRKTRPYEVPEELSFFGALSKVPA